MSRLRDSALLDLLPKERVDELLREAILNEKLGPHCRCQNLAVELLDRAVAAEAERDNQRRRAERAERRCWAEHPTNRTMIDCCLDRGHEGDHWSTTGCSGSEATWPR